MHIAFLTPEYPHPKISYSAGIGTSIKNLADSLSQKGIKVSVFVYSQDKNDRFFDKQVSIYKIKRKSYLLGNWFLHRKHIQNFIKTIIIKDNIDIIESPDWTGITAFMNFKCPIVVKIHGSDTYFCHLEGRKQKFKNFLFEKIALKSANYLVAVSQFSSEITKSLFSLQKTIHVLHNPIDTDIFAPSKSLSNVDNLEILYFGSIIRKKGVLELAHIFNHIVNHNTKIKLKLVGKDVVDSLTKKSTYSLFLEILSNEAKERVSYTDLINYSEIPNYINSASLVIQPSFAEALPMTWIETMSSAKVLISSDIGWATELITHGETGFMFNPKNHKKIADVIIKIIYDKELKEKISCQARKYIIENFSKKVISEKHITFYKNIISNEV